MSACAKRPDRPTEVTRSKAIQVSAPRPDVATDAPVVLANVSRRRFLQGVTALGGLVLAAGFPSAVRAADPPKFGADGMPNGWWTIRRVRGHRP